MKEPQLKSAYREALIKSPHLRKLISIDIFSHEQTILRWTRGVPHSPKLCAPFFLRSLKKHTNAKEDISDMTELVEMEVHPEA